MRVRLKPAWNSAQLADLYSATHDYRGWLDHRLRVPVTSRLAQWLADEYSFTSAADLSCGEGAALNALTTPVVTKHYGDIVSGWPFCGPIEKTITEIPPVDLLICGETIEHLDDPDSFLVVTRKQVKSLVVSTPVGSWGDGTPGHYWAWDRESVEAMLRTAGFTVVTYLFIDFSGLRNTLPHDFGIWACL